MAVSADQLKRIEDQLKALVQQVEGLRAQAEQEELTAGREGFPGPRLTRRS